MSETVKLIVEIPKEIMEYIKNNDCLSVIYIDEVAKVIQNGIPLDSNDSDRAEAQAYFDGESYGWEQGRKALIDELKAEIQEKVKSVEGGNAYHVANGLNMALSIINKYTGGDKE